MVKAKMVYATLPPITKRVNEMLDEYCLEVITKQLFEPPKDLLIEETHVHRIVSY